MRVFLADAEPDVRSALHLVLSREPGLDVVGEASRAQGLLKRLQAARPDLLLLDWELPGSPAAALLLALNGLDVEPRVIVLSKRPESEPAALAAGADAFVSKTDPPEQLLTALRSLVQSHPRGIART